MDRKTYKQIQQDQIETMLNAQELSAMMVDFEQQTIKLAAAIDKTKDKKKRAKLEAKLNTLIRIVENVNTNASLLSH